jgi:hypothetical protein
MLTCIAGENAARLHGAIAAPHILVENVEKLNSGSSIFLAYSWTRRKIAQRRHTAYKRTARTLEYILRTKDRFVTACFYRSHRIGSGLRIGTNSIQLVYNSIKVVHLASRSSFRTGRESSFNPVTQHNESLYHAIGYRMANNLTHGVGGSNIH